jgi:hypothetical protein
VLRHQFLQSLSLHQWRRLAPALAASGHRLEARDASEPIGARPRPEKLQPRRSSP